MIQFDQILKHFDYLTKLFSFEIRPRLVKDSIFDSIVTV